MAGTLREQELLEIIRQQAQRFEHLEAEHRALKAENARLKKRLEDLERKSRKYAAPHSRETRKADPKPSGRRAGEGPFTYKQAPTPEQITQVIEVEVPNTCAACGFSGELLFKRQDKAWITELAAERAQQLTEYHVPVMTCPACGSTVRGVHPDLAADQYGSTAHRCGPRLKASLQVLHHEVGLPQRRLPRVLYLTTGIRITQGAVTQDAQRLAEDAGPLAAHVQTLEADLRAAAFVHHDDTGWRISAGQAWVSTFRSAQTVLFTANHQHTNIELRKVLGNAFQGVLVCDRFKVYDSRMLDQVKQQKCLAHLIRNADEVAAGEQKRPGRGQEYGLRLAQVFRDGIKLHRRSDEGWCTQEEYRQQGEGLTLRLETLLRRAPLKTKANERLRLGILEQHLRGRILLFLSDPEIPPTNNAAERSLRTVVMARKVSQCSKNARGATTYMRIKSTVETARLRGQNSVDVLMSLRS